MRISHHGAVAARPRGATGDSGISANRPACSHLSHLQLRRLPSGETPPAGATAFLSSTSSNRSALTRGAGGSRAPVRRMVGSTPKHRKTASTRGGVWVRSHGVDVGGGRGLGGAAHAHRDRKSPGATTEPTEGSHPRGSPGRRAAPHQSQPQAQRCTLDAESCQHQPPRSGQRSSSLLLTRAAQMRRRWLACLTRHWMRRPCRMLLHRHPRGIPAGRGARRE